MVNDVASDEKMLEKELELRGALRKFRDPEREDSGSGWMVEERLTTGVREGRILSSVTWVRDRELRSEQSL